MPAMAKRQYDTLAGVYDSLVPEALLEPEGAAAAFADVLAGLEPGAPVLDCACGTGRSRSAWRCAASP